MYGTINMTRKVCKHLNRDDVVTLKRLQRERERERERESGREREREGELERARASAIYIYMFDTLNTNTWPLSFLA